MVAARHAGELADAVRQQAAVGQVGERVQVGQADQVALHLACLRDVVEDADVVRHGAARVALLLDGGPAGVEAAVLARGADLALPLAGGLQRGAHLAPHVAPVDAEAERGRVLALQFVGAVAADVAERLVDRDDAAVAVGDDEAFARLLEHGPGQVQLVFHRLALGDVAPLHQQVGLDVARARDRADRELQRQRGAVRAPEGEFVSDDRAAHRLRDDGLQGGRLRLGHAQRGDLVQAAAGDVGMGHAQPLAAGAVHVAHGALRVEHADEVRAAVDQPVGQALALHRAARANGLGEQCRCQAQQADDDQPEQPQGQGDARLGRGRVRRERGRGPGHAQEHGAGTGHGRGAGGPGASHDARTGAERQHPGTLPWIRAPGRGNKAQGRGLFHTAGHGDAPKAEVAAGNCAKRVAPHREGGYRAGP